MKTRAAVAVAAGKPLEIMEVDLDGPLHGEVLVEIMATGIVILMNSHVRVMIQKAYFQQFWAMKGQGL